MKPAPFKYFSATSAEHALALLAEQGEDARLLAGGQSLVAMMNFRVARPTALIDLARCEDLDFIELRGQMLHIGAMTRQKTAEHDPLVVDYCPLLSRALSVAGPTTVRNRGTIGGSIANGYPLAHTIAIANCLSAEICVQNSEGSTWFSPDQFFLDAMVTKLEPGDLVRECRFPVMGAKDRFVFRQIANHAGGAALCIVVMHARRYDEGSITSLAISVSGIAGVAIRLKAVELASCDMDVPHRVLNAAYLQDLAAAGYIEEESDEQAHFVVDVAFKAVLEGFVEIHQATESGV